MFKEYSDIYLCYITISIEDKGIYLHRVSHRETL